MRILIYGSSPRLESGMGKVGREMALGLAREHEVHYYTPQLDSGPPMDFPPEADLQFTIHGCPGGPPGRGHFHRVVDDVRAELVVSNRNWQSLNWLHNPLNNRYTSTGIRTPVLMYGPPVETEHYPPNFKEQLIDPHLNDVYMVPYTGNRYDYMTGDWAVDLSDVVPDGGPGYIPHGIDHDVFYPRDDDARTWRQELGIGDRFAVLCIAENWRRKNLDLLMDAFMNFKQEVQDEANPVLMLHSSPTSTRGDDNFYGGWNLTDTALGYDMTVATELNQIDEDTDVFWTVQHVGHYLPREYVASMLSAADVYCLPTSGESFSLTSLEAMATGTPVVQTDVPTLRWLCGDAAEYIAPVQDHAINNGERHVTPSVSMMTAKLLDVYHDPDRREEMAELGRERAQDFSWGRMGSELLECVNWIAEEA